MIPPATASDAVLNQTLQRLTERYAAIAQEVLGDNLLRYWDLKPDFKPGEVITL